MALRGLPDVYFAKQLKYYSKVHKSNVFSRSKLFSSKVCAMFLLGNYCFLRVDYVTC